MGKSTIKGLSKVVRKLNKEIKNIEGRTLKGLIRGGIVVLRDVELNEPYTPLFWGNLRSSRFLVTSSGGTYFGRSPAFKGKLNAAKMTGGHVDALNEAKVWAKVGKSIVKGPVVVMGFSAFYAAAIHEKLNVRHWSRKGSGPKFFEKAIDRNISEILNKIRKEAKIK